MHDDTRPESSPGMEARTQAEAADDAPSAGTSLIRERIGVGGGDENVAKIQLAARWAELTANGEDSLDGVLQRFKRAYFYIDSVTKLVDPENS